MKDRGIQFVRSQWNSFKHLSTRKKVLVVSGFSVFVLLAVPLVTYAYYARDISNPERLMNRNNTGIVLMDKDGKVFYSFGRNGNQKDVPLSSIADELEHALIASEDEAFYEHQGYSLKGMAVALYANVLNKDLTRYGGSTITQQLVKNNLLSSNKNFFRKYQELSISIAVDRHYSKDKILEMYLNSIYFGEGAFGIDQAAEKYFGKEPSQLSLAESSLLIGILPAPSAYSPISGDMQMAQTHQERVLGRMVEAGYINSSQMEAALNEKLTYQKAQVAVQEHAQHFAEMVLSQLHERYGEEKITRSGYRVTTSLDLDWQKQGEKFVAARVAELSSQGGDNASMVAIDPKTGQVRVLVGSSDWNNPDFGQVNMATVPRQPGSSFKPIFYTEALDRELITPATILEDKPKSYGSYRPLNYDFRFLGDISARKALAQSRNLPAIEVIQKLGVDEASQAARRMGISDVTEPQKYGLTLALGTAEVKLLDMTNAYATFANRGRQFSPTLILSIKDKFDRTIHKDKTRSKEVIGPEASFLISSILSDIEARGFGFSSLNIPGRTVAAKTGTTNDNRDAWTIGYTPSLSVGVWVGNNRHEAMSGVAGGSGAGPIWRNSMQAFLDNSPREEFDKPRGIAEVLVCANGQRADRPGHGVREEYFIRGTEPSGECFVPREQPKKDKRDEKEDKKDNRGQDNDEEEEPPEPPEEEEPPEEPPEDPPEDPPPPPQD